MAVRAKLTVVDRDLGYKKWIREMKNVAKNSPGLWVGVFGDPNGRGDEELLTIALVHEFGSPKMNVPARSWLRASFDKYEKQWMALLLRLLKLVDKGKLTLRNAVELVGQQMVADIRRHIRSGIPPPLKPATIARKGSTLPLVDSGRFINSITYQVRGF